MKTQLYLIYAIKMLFKKGHIIDSINVKSDDFAQQKMDKYKNKPFILISCTWLRSPNPRQQNPQPKVINRLYWVVELLRGKMPICL